MADFTVSGEGSALGATGSVAGVGIVANTGTLADTGTVAADTAEAETDTYNRKNRNRVVIFFILSILVGKYSEEFFRLARHMQLLMAIGSIQWQSGFEGGKELPSIHVAFSVWVIAMFSNVCSCPCN
jgi:hypothetical protein